MNPLSTKGRIWVIASVPLPPSQMQSIRVSLEVVLQTKLHGAGTMRVHWVQKGIPDKTTGVAGGVIRATVAGNRVAAGVALVGIVDAELGMVENVERFYAKFEVAAFGDFEMFQQSNVKVQPARVVQEIASGISESKTLWSAECRRIPQDRANTLVVISTERRGLVGVADYIWIRPGARPIRHPGIVEHGDASAAPAVDYAERCA